MLSRPRAATVQEPAPPHLRAAQPRRDRVQLGSQPWVECLWPPSAVKMRSGQRGRKKFWVCASLGGWGLAPAVAAQNPVIDQFCISRCTGRAHLAVQLQEEYQALLPLRRFMETHTSFTRQESRAVSGRQPLRSPVPSRPQRWLALLNISRRGSAVGSILPCSSMAIKGCNSCGSALSGLLSLCDRWLLGPWLGNWKQKLCSGITWLADWGCSSSTGQANLLG